MINKNILTTKGQKIIYTNKIIRIMQKKITFLSLLVIVGTVFGMMNITNSVEAGHPDAVRWVVKEELKTEKITEITSVEVSGVNNSSGSITYQEQNGSQKTFVLDPIPELLYQPRRPVMVFINEKYQYDPATLAPKTMEALVGLPLKNLRVERRTSYLLFGAGRGNVLNDGWYVFAVKGENKNQGNNQGNGNQQNSISKAEGFIQGISLSDSSVIVGKEGKNANLLTDSNTVIQLNGASADLSDLNVGDKVEKAVYDSSTNILISLKVKRE